MAGIVGVISPEGDCARDLHLGLFYLQHRSQDYSGFGIFDGDNLKCTTHKGHVNYQFPFNDFCDHKVLSGVGAVSRSRQPVSESSSMGEVVFAFDGNIINQEELKELIFMERGSFSGFSNPQDIKDNVIAAKIVSRESSFEEGIKKLTEQMKGDFSIIALTQKGIYAARGWGRKPLVIGKKEGCYMVASESNPFENTGYNLFRDVKPGEIVLINHEGVNTVAQLDLAPTKFGTFEWIYTSHPASTIDGRNVAETRIKIGKALAKRYPVKADIVSCIPNSGRWHGIGYAHGSNLPYTECFVRYDYSDRSFTPSTKAERDLVAETKLIPIESQIKGKRIILCDDSIVRGTQMLNRVKKLKELGAKEVHARIACPPLMAACKFGKTTKKDEDCIARRISLDELKQALNLDSLEFATIEDVEQTLNITREKLCLSCWEIKQLPLIEDTQPQ